MWETRDLEYECVVSLFSCTFQNGVVHFLQVLISNQSPDSWYLAAQLSKKLRESADSFALTRVSVEALDAILIECAVWGKNDAMYSILQVWGTPKVLSSAFLSIAVTSKEILHFQLNSSSSIRFEEPTVGDIFRVVGVVAPAWARALDLAMVPIVDTNKSGNATARELSDFVEFCRSLQECEKVK